MVKYIILLSLLVFTSVASNAQDLSFGFKAGLNFSRINTDDIEQENGMDLEDFGQNSGFHLGIVVSTKFTEIFGARGELLYSQKGGRYEYEGPSYLDLNTFISDERVTRTGFRSMNMNISNAYLELPISIYARPVKWFEISAGVSAGVLLNAVANGELTFQESTQSADDAFEGITLDFRYFGDDAGDFDANAGEEVRMINGVTFELPKTIGAYYDYPDGAQTNLFKRYDLGVHAGFNLYINKSLFVGGRLNYGLSDITDGDADRSLVAKDGDNLILRDDTDRNLSFQASIGFSF